MNRRRFLLGLSASLLTAKTALADSGFEAFRRQQQRGYSNFSGATNEAFESYQEELRAAFADYKEATQAATEAWRRELSQVWRNPELSDRTTWVEYAANNTIKRVVDFERNLIRIEVPTSGDGLDQIVRQQLVEILSEDTRTAFEHDPVAQAVEERLGQRAQEVVERGQPANQPVLSELFGQGQPSAREVEAKAAQLLRAAKRESRAEVPEGASSENIVSITVPLPDDRPMKKAAEYRKLVQQHAVKWDIEDALVLAVIHTESSFNPMARSPVPAYGLMQIVPQSAGQDATKLVYGKAKVVAPSYLYDSEKNVRLGTAYLNILLYRYLKRISDPETRLYCAIAAYNTGAGNVARAFTGRTSITGAYETINRYKPARAYQHLIDNLPYDETKHYLERVASRLKIYRNV